MNSDAEFELIAATQAELSAVLSVVKRTELNGVQKYLLPMCVGITDLASGFYFLKKAGNLHAARVLIRTCIEATLKVAAVHKKPCSLYRIAFTEQMGDVKFLKAADENQIIVKPEMIDGRRKSISPGLKSLFPGEKLEDRIVPIEILAQWAELQELYDFYFRLYSNYTHATIRAHVNPDNFLVEADQSAILGCLYATASIAGESLGATSKRLTCLVEQINSGTQS